MTSCIGWLGLARLATTVTPYVWKQEDVDQLEPTGQTLID